MSTCGNVSASSGETAMKIGHASLDSSVVEGGIMTGQLWFLTKTMEES